MTKRVFALFTAICLLCGLALGGMAVPAYAVSDVLDFEDVEIPEEGFAEDWVPEGWSVVKPTASRNGQTFAVAPDPEDPDNMALKLNQVSPAMGSWNGIKYEIEPTSQIVTLEYRYNVDDDNTNFVLLPSFVYEADSPTFPVVLKTKGGTVYYSTKAGDSAAKDDVVTRDNGVWHTVKHVVDIANKTCELWLDGTKYELTTSSIFTFDDSKYKKISGVMFGNSPSFRGTVYLDDMVVTVGTPGEEVAVPEISQNTLSLEGDIGVNYYTIIPDAVKNDANAKIRFTQAGGKSGETLISQGVDKTLNGVDYTRFTWRVAAKEMNDEIKAQIFYGDGQSTEENTYSVKDYADYIQNDYTGADKEIWQNLMTAMLNYGALAQKQFNYNADALVTDLTNVTFDVDADDLISFKSQGEGTAKAKFWGTGLLLKSQTILRVYFQVEDGVTPTVKKGEDTLNATERNGLWYVDIENISAPDLGELITLTVGDGTETAEIKVCPLSYCYDVLNGATNDETLLNLVKALYQYYEAAVEAFQ